MSLRWRWAFGTLAVLGALVIAMPFVAEKPLRAVAERQLNACVKGYNAHIGALDLRPISLSVHLRNLQISQDAHPDPPIVRIPRISTDVQLASMIRGRVVANVLVDEVQVNAERAHVLRELENPVALVKDCALLKALRVLHAINRFQLRNSSVTYVDSAQARPLTLRALNMDIHTIRIARAQPDVYPSPLTVEAVVFDDGRLSVDGAADLLQEPYPAFKGHFEVARIALDYLTPLVAPYGLRVTRGMFGAAGTLEYAPDVTVVDLEHVEVDGLQGDYAYSKPAAQPAKEAVKKAAAKAQETSSAPDVVLKARRISVKDATLGFINEDAQPRYRIFLSDITLQMENFANQLTEGIGTARLTGRFMGSGKTVITATLRPETKGPDFDLSTSIEEIDLRQMNDMLRAHAKIDVASGLFSVYSEMHVKNGRVEGYVKPLLRDLEAYQLEQDREKSIGQKIKEKALNIAGKLLRNHPRKEVATVTPIAGPLENPKASTWEAIVGLVQNAFIKAILPGFVDAGKRAASRGAS
jgi:Domain of Unknown Function (DUF748)